MGPKRFTTEELKKVGVKMIASGGWLQCEKCGQKWSPNIYSPGGGDPEDIGNALMAATHNYFSINQGGGKMENDAFDVKAAGKWVSDKEILKIQEVNPK